MPVLEIEGYDGHCATHELVGQANSIMVNLLFCQIKLTEESSHAYRAAAPAAPMFVELEFRLQAVLISVSESTSNSHVLIARNET